MPEKTHFVTPWIMRIISNIPTSPAFCPVQIDRFQAALRAIIFVHCVRDHVRDGETALVVDGLPRSYMDAIRKVLDPANKTEIDKMCKVARKTVLERFTFQNHAMRLLAVLDATVLENSRT